MKNRILFHIKPLPANQAEAVRWLLALVRATDHGTLREVPAGDFKRGWFAVGFLYPGLHPDAALNHGTAVSSKAEDCPEIRAVEPRLLAPSYVESGWPVVLAPVADEARRRSGAGELRDEEFYCSEAVIAGMCSRNPELAGQTREQRDSTAHPTSGQ